MVFSSSSLDIVSELYQRVQRIHISGTAGKVAFTFPGVKNVRKWCKELELAKHLGSD